jgi:hypothetical protein
MNQNALSGTGFNSPFTKQLGKNPTPAGPQTLRVILVGKSEFLDPNLLPACLTTDMTAKILGLHEDHVRLISGTKFLMPLGEPERNSVKYYATVDVLALRENRDSLHEVVCLIGKHHANKNKNQQERKEQKQ